MLINFFAERALFVSDSWKLMFPSEFRDVKIPIYVIGRMEVMARLDSSVQNLQIIALKHSKLLEPSLIRSDEV